MQLVEQYGGKYMTVRSKRLFTSTGSDTPPVVHYTLPIALTSLLFALLDLIEDLRTQSQ